MTAAPGASVPQSVSPSVASAAPSQAVAAIETNSRSQQQLPSRRKAPIMDAFGNPLELPAHISPHQIFELLDQALPFEVCLFLRVLPLALEGNQLQLGMVDIHDQQALDYVGRIAAYSDRYLTPIFLAGHLHQVILSAYLHHSSQPAQGPSITDPILTAPTATQLSPTVDETVSSLASPTAKPEEYAAETLPSSSSLGIESSESPALEEWELETLFPSDTTVQEIVPPRDIESAPNIEQTQETTQPTSSPSYTQTLDVEHPNYLETRSTSEVKAQSITQRRQEPAPVISQRMTLILDETEIMAELAQASPSETNEPPTLIEGQPSRSQQELNPAHRDLPRDIIEEVPPSPEQPGLPASLDALQRDEITQQSWETTAHLPPKLLLEAMLGRMLQRNITRLRMERYRRPQNNGDLAQLFWNPSGILQTPWDGFSLGAFGALAKALRELAQLPQGPIQNPIQRGVMRRYQGQPLLLLMQFLPGAQVAVIELRLLQGEALREFQKHQGQDLGRETLLTAQTLQYQVQQLLDHHQRYPELSQIPEHLVTVIQQLGKAIAQPTQPQR